MKNILITGAKSYIGTSFENYMKQFDGYNIETVDMLDDSWRKKDFSIYDVVFHVAGIAHSDTKNVSEETKKKYYAVNTDLTVETAKKAKESGVGQFIFMSSIIVYGSANEYISNDTIPKPDNFYGDSKFRADNAIHTMQSDKFNVVSVRPPMIYGKGSNGNYPRLSALAKKTPFFPDFNNQRSMLYINNLCECIRLIIDNEEKGYFYPQNSEYVKTSELVKIINPKIKLTSVFNFAIRLLKNVTIFKKVFGNLTYDKKMSECFQYKYCIKGFEESVKETEGIL